MSASGFLGFGSTSWKEEVLLHDGSKIVVERWVSRGGRHEIGQKSPIKEQRLTFLIANFKERITWKTEYSQDIGLADFKPILLDFDQGTAYMVSVPVGCLSYNKWGRPNPPYVIHKYQRGEWQRLALQELPALFITPNLIISSPDSEIERIRKSFVTAEEIKQINSSLRQPEYRSILREPIKPKTTASAVNCEEMVSDGKGGWLGVDWFTSQPTYEACQKVCERRSISQQYCPCNHLFGRK